MIPSQIPDPPESIAPFRSDWSEAAVLAGPVRIPYRCAGSGPPVLVLTNDPRSAARPMAEALRKDFRVIVPESRAGAAIESTGRAESTERLSCSAWVRLFMDGLGLRSASIVAEGAMALSCLGFALAEPERVDRLVCLLLDPPDALLDHYPPDRLVRSGHSLLLVRIGEMDDLSAEARQGPFTDVRRFLSGGDGPPE